MKIASCASYLWFWIPLLHNTVPIMATPPLQPYDGDSPQFKPLHGLRHLQGSTCSPRDCVPTATNCVAECSGTSSKCAYSVPCTPETNKCKGCFGKQCKSVDCTPDGTNAFCTASCANGTFGPSCVKKGCTKDTNTGYCTTCVKGSNGNPNGCVRAEYCVPGADAQNSCVAECNNGRCVYAVSCVGGTCKDGVCTVQPIVAPSASPLQAPSLAPPLRLPPTPLVSSPRILRAGSVTGLFLTITYQWAESQGDLTSGVSFSGTPLTDCLDANPVYVTGSGRTMTYQWSATQADLDSGVASISSSRGVDCLGVSPPNETSETGVGNLGVNANGFGHREAFNINLGQAFVDGVWKRDTLIRLRTGWNKTGTGPVKVTLSTRRVLADGTVVHGTDSVSFGINSTANIPGNCAEDVGTIGVIRNPDGSVTIQANTQQSGDKSLIGEALRNP
jgi:hypothetical protein